MTKTNGITVLDIVQGSYAYMRAAALPALTGTLIYAITSSFGDFIRQQRMLGDQSTLASVVIFAVMAVIWLAMSLRQGLGKPRKGVFGLSVGMDELRLASSTIGFLFVVSIVLSLLAFGVFLLVMIVAAAGAGALAGEEVAEAEIFTTPQAFTDFLTSGGAGTFVAVSGGAILFGAVLFLVLLVLRLLPFAAATIDQKRFVVLQAADWTRYQNTQLLFGGLLTIGVGALFITTARYSISQLPLPLLLDASLKHIASCFGALLFVGFISTTYRSLAIKESGPE